MSRLPNPLSHPKPSTHHTNPTSPSTNSPHHRIIADRHQTHTNSPKIITDAHREWKMFYNAKYRDEGYVAREVPSRDMDEEFMEGMRGKSGVRSALDTQSDESPRANQQEKSFSQRVEQFEHRLNDRHRDTMQHDDTRHIPQMHEWSDDEHSMTPPSAEPSPTQISSLQRDGALSNFVSPPQSANHSPRHHYRPEGEHSKMDPHDEDIMKQLLNDNSEGLHMLEELSSRMSHLEISLRDDSGVLHEPSSIISSHKSPPKSISSGKKDSKHVEELYEIIGYLERRLEQERRDRLNGVSSAPDASSAQHGGVSEERQTPSRTSGVHSSPSDKVEEMRNLLNEERERWNRERIDLIRQLDQKNKQFETLKSGHNHDLETLSSDTHDDSSQWKQQYQQLLAKYQRQNSQLTSIRKQLTEEIFELKQKNTRLQEENILLGSMANKKSSENIMEYKKQCILLSNDLELARDKELEARKKIESLESELVQLAEERRELARSNVSLTQKVDALNEQIRALTRKHQSRDNDDAELQTLRKDNEKLRNELDKARTSPSSKTSANTRAQQKILQENEDMKRLLNELQTELANFEGLQAQNEKMAHFIDEQRQENEGLRVLLSKVKVTASQYSSELKKQNNKLQLKIDKLEKKLATTQTVRYAEEESGPNLRPVR